MHKAAWLAAVVWLAFALLYSYGDSIPMIKEWQGRDRPITPDSPGPGNSVNNSNAFKLLEAGVAVQAATIATLRSDLRASDARAGSLEDAVGALQSAVAELSPPPTHTKEASRGRVRPANSAGNQSKGASSADAAVPTQNKAALPPATHKRVAKATLKIGTVGWGDCERPVCDLHGECRLPWINRTHGGTNAATPEGTNSARCCSDVLFEYLNDAHQMLQSIDPEHFVMYGTLLGAVRDQDVIPWETDVDFVVNAPIYDRWTAWKNVFAGRGYILFKSDKPQLHACKARQTDGTLHKAPWSKGNWFPYVDIYRLSQTNRTHVQTNQGRRTYRVNDISPTSECTIRQQPFPCVARPAAVLKAFYGDWKKPDPLHHDWRKNAVITEAGAQFNLGVNHSKGGVAGKGVAEAIKWFQLAAGQGHQEALKALDTMQHDNLIPTPPRGTAINTVLLTSAASISYNHKHGTVVASTQITAIRPGHVAVLLDGEAAPIPLKLMNLRILK